LIAPNRAYQRVTTSMAHVCNFPLEFSQTLLRVVATARYQDIGNADRKRS
jgi:hypothetical protein